MADETLTPEETALLQQLYENLFTRAGDLVVGDDVAADLQRRGLIYLYGPHELKYYAGYFEPAGPQMSEQPVSLTQAGAEAIGMPWPIEDTHRERIWQREIAKIRKA